MKTLKHLTSQFLACSLLALFSLTAYAEDESLAIQKAVATSTQSGEGIARAYDGDLSTLWHSSYSSTRFPVNATFILKESAHVDYVKYTPRQSGTNGNFDEVEVYVSSDETTAYTKVTQLAASVKLGGVGSASYIYLGDDGFDDVRSIRLCIKSGSGGWASAAEIAFYKADRSKEEALKSYFTDNLCTELRSDVTSDDGIEDETVKTLVSALLTDAEGYKKYRVGEYEPYETLSTLQQRLKTNHQYCSYENPTGIYFEEGETIYVMAEGIQGEAPASLIIKNFGKATDDEPQSQSSFALRNGMNAITPSHRGNSYVSYYSDDFATLPNVKLHFINAKVNGYFDLQRGDTNDDWKALLKNAVSDILDVRTQRLQVAFPLATFKANCPSNGVELAEAYDEIVYREREVMGLPYYNSEPKNRQFFRVVHSGFMFADGIGAAVHQNSVGACISGTPSKLDFWGMAHELGHNNQLTRSFKWTGCGETTNNIYSAWVQYNLGNKNSLRLEDEVTGIDDYAGMRGGRFESYLEEGVRKGISWQLQDGPDYHGSSFNTNTVKDEDYNGKTLTKTVTVESRNFDHFVKVVPLWQLQLYTHLAGRSPNMYGKVMEAMRHADDDNLSNGQLQMQFMKLVCDNTGMNFLPFFEKAGMLKPINAYIEDYAKGWLKISDAMIDDLKSYVAEKGYEAITDEVNYITAHNWQIFADRLPLEGGTLGQGCTASGSLVKVSHSIWKNAVAFETYNSEDELIRISMYGLGSNDAHSYTQVLYPQAEDAAYIMAVGYDGTRVRCYEAVSKTFKPGKELYRITSRARGYKALSTVSMYADPEGSFSSDVLDHVTTVAASATDVSQLWRFEAADEGFRLVSPNTGMALGGAAGQKAFMAAPSDGGVYALVNSDGDIWALNNKSNGQYLNAFNGSGSSDVGHWSGGVGDNNNLWRIEKVEQLNYVLSSSQWNTLNLPFAVSVPDELVAYIATGTGVVDGNDVLLLEPLGGSVVPAATPVIINGPAATYQLTILPDDDTQAPSTNLLRGTLARRTGFASKSVAVVSKNATTGPGIYFSSSANVVANRVYMLAEDLPALTNPGNGLLLSIGHSDAIDTHSWQQPQQPTVLYDLNGRRVDAGSRALPRGVYVTANGKKIMKM